MKISQKTAQTLQVPADPLADVWYWDDQLKGFAIRVRGNGSRAYWIKYRVNNRSLKKNLGSIDDTKAEAARTRARDILEAARHGKDLVGVERAVQDAHTIRDLARIHQELHRPPTIEQSTFEGNAGIWRKHIVPELGSKKIRTLAIQDIQRLHLKLAETPYAANRMLACLSKALNDCERWTPAWRDRGTNPCQDIEKFPELERQTILEPEDMVRLKGVLDAWKALHKPGPLGWWAGPYLIEVLLVSGLRLREWACAEWSWINRKRQTLTVPKAKTDDGFVSHLSATTLAILDSMPRPHQWVFPNASGTGPMKWPAKMWEKIRAEADMETLRLHDIRHTFASYAHMDGGLSLKEVGALLGHTNASTTLRYLNVMDKRKRQANDRGAEAVLKAFNGPKIAAE